MLDCRKCVRPTRARSRFAAETSRLSDGGNVCLRKCLIRVPFSVGMVRHHAFFTTLPWMARGWSQQQGSGSQQIGSGLHRRGSGRQMGCLHTCSGRRYVGYEYRPTRLISRWLMPGQRCLPTSNTYGEKNRYPTRLALLLPGITPALLAPPHENRKKNASLPQAVCYNAWPIVPVITANHGGSQ